MGKDKPKEHIKLRYNLTSIFIYICGVIMLLQLFNLQITHGAEYRATSNTRLTRETVLQAARGRILDRTGNVIAGTEMTFDLELYKTKIEDQDLNENILRIIQVLEKNGDKYIDSFPITIEPFAYTFSTEEGLANFKNENEIPETATAEEAFQFFKEKYKIENENIQEARKIMAIRYEIQEAGYSVTKPITIAKKIKRESAIEFSERNASFSGVTIRVQSARTYPKGSLASHIIGYIGKIDEKEYDTKKDSGYSMNDYIGKTGIELMFEEYLRGENGIRQIDMDVDGTTSGEYVYQEATAGHDVVLTIDANLQEVAETALANNIAKISQNGYEVPSGAVVVMNVNTGEVIAMASYPDYEPIQFMDGISNEKWKEYNDKQALYNRAISGTYAPGSIFKMVSAIAGLETGVITTTEKIQDRGIYPEGHNPVCWIWSDYRGTHGWLNVSDAIKHSCNYFFYEVGNRMGIDNLAKYATYFGLGQKTNIELPGESSGTLASRQNYEAQGKTWYLGNTLSAVIGQGENSFTPLQMVRYISMIANGGKRIEPTIIKSVIDANGNEVNKEELNTFVNEKLGITEEIVEDLNIKEENLEAVREGMKGVTTESGGTAYSIFRNFNIEVAGKTGSAQTGTSYTNAWFAGFAPYTNPEIAVVVFVENGKHGSSTAEVVRDIIKEYFGMNAGDVNESTTAIPATGEIR